MTFKALLIEKDDAGYRASVKDVGDDCLLYTSPSPRD